MGIFKKLIVEETMRCPFQKREGVYWGEYLVCLFDRNVPFFSVSFSSTGYQKRTIFLEPVLKRCQKKIFVRVGCCFVQSYVLCFGVWEYTLQRFFFSIIH